MESKDVGTRHGAATRAKLDAAGNAARRALYTLGRGIDKVAGCATNTGFAVGRYVRGFASGLLRAGTTTANAEGEQPCC